jgi:hypothetical protein
MNTIPVYAQLYKLYYSNQILLKNYAKLYSDLDDNDRKNSAKLAELGHRIGLRESIRLQLGREILQARHNGAGVGKASFAAIHFRAILDYHFRHLILGRGWNACSKREKKNLREYYRSLYSDGLSHEQTNLLLQQKTKIEWQLGL